MYQFTQTIHPSARDLTRCQVLESHDLRVHFKPFENQRWIDKWTILKS